MEEKPEFKCTMCNLGFSTSEGEVVFQHVQYRHRLTLKFYAVCPVYKCNHIFHKFSTYQRHWHQNHTKGRFSKVYVGGAENKRETEGIFSTCQPRYAQIDSEIDTDEEFIGLSNLAEVIDDMCMISQNQQTSLEPSQGYQKFWSGALLKMHYEFNLSFDGLEVLQNIFIESIERLNASGMATVLNDPEHFFMTRSAIETSWKKNFPTVEPQTLIVSTSRKPVWDSSNNRLNDHQTNFTGQLIPFKDALQQLLSVGSISEAVQQSFKQNEARLKKGTSKLVYQDVWDGELIRSNPVFVRNNGHVLGIQIWHDETELCNALGSRAGGRSKLGLFHWTLMNLPPRLRSNLHSVNLLGIIEASLLKEFGAEVFLKKFLNELKEFEEGITLNLGGKEQKIPCILTNLVGDLPAMNWLGGFKEGVSFAHRPCRVCLVSRNELDVTHSRKDFILREKESHDQHLKKIILESDSKLREQASKEHGVNGDCCFRTISYFDPTKFSSHDIMHLFDEGVLNLECRLLLNHLIEGKIIDIEVINRELGKLKYFREFAKPLQLSKDEIVSKSKTGKSKKLSLSSTEMHSLSLVLPVILSKYVDFRENRYYSNFLLLLEISAFVRFYWFEEEDIDMLAVMVACHNKCFVSLYAKEVSVDDTQTKPTITPKLHALVHLADQIRLHGPPRYSWSYKYESANVPLKKVMRRNSNNKNIAFTVASFYQKNIAKRIADFRYGDYFEMRIDCDPRVYKTKRMRVKESQFFEIITKCEYFCCDQEDYFTFAAGVKLSGRDCHIGSVFVKQIYRPDQLELPLFWAVAEIITIGSATYVIMQSMTTISFQQGAFSFILEPNKVFKLIRIADLQPYVVPLHAFWHDHVLHVVPEYYHLL